MVSFCQHINANKIWTTPMPPKDGNANASQDISSQVIWLGSQKLSSEQNRHKRWQVIANSGSFFLADLHVGHDGHVRRACHGPGPFRQCDAGFEGRGGVGGWGKLAHWPWLLLRFRPLKMSAPNLFKSLESAAPRGRVQDCFCDFVGWSHSTTSQPSIYEKKYPICICPICWY